MNYKTYMQEVDEQLKQMSEKEKTAWIRQLARTTKEQNRGVFLERLKQKERNDFADIDIEAINEWCRQVKAGDVYFERELSEDVGSYYWDNDSYDYFDEYGIRTGFEKTRKTADSLLNQKSYSQAKAIYDQLLSLTFTVHDDSMDDWYDVDLEEAVLDEILSVEITDLIVQAAYATYQTEKGHKKAQMIYDYLTRDYAQPIKLEAVFRIGPEELTDISGFIENWIQFLLDIDDDQAATLLLEACLYQGGVDRLIETAEVGYKTHPVLYLHACTRLLEDKAFNRCESVGLKALNALPENLVIRGEIANVTRVSATKLNHQAVVHQCYKLSFQSHSTLMNFFNLCHLPESKDVIKDVATQVDRLPEQVQFDRDRNHKQHQTNYLSKNQKNILYFFSGKFKDVYEQCQKGNTSIDWRYSLRETMTTLFMLLLNQDTNITKVKQLLSARVINHLDYQASAEDFLADFQLWKSKVTVEKDASDYYLSWLRQEVDQHTESIVGEGDRKNYDQAALLIAGFGETLASRGLIESKVELLDYYKQMHSRKTAFKKACDTLR